MRFPCGEGAKRDDPPPGRPIAEHKMLLDSGKLAQGIGVGNRFAGVDEISLTQINIALDWGVVFFGFALSWGSNLRLFRGLKPPRQRHRAHRSYTRAVHRNPASNRALTALLAVVVLYIALTGAPVRVAIAVAPAPPVADVCGGLHGSPIPTAPDHHDPVPGHHGCGTCAFCAAPSLALPPASPPPLAAVTATVQPFDAAATARADWRSVVARARGPPAPA